MAKGKQAGNKTKQVAAPSNALTSYGVNGNFGAAAYNNARAAGMTPDQIRSLTAGSGLKIGAGVDAVLNPGKYDQGYTPEAFAANPDSVIGRGLYGGGLPSQDGNSYGLEGFVVPGATNGIGPNKNVLFMADPGQRGNTYAERQAWMNSMFAPGGRYYGGASTGMASPGTEAAAPGTAAPQAMTKEQKFSAMKGAENYRQALKIAAMNDSTISAKEANAINRQFGVSPDKMVDRLDSINSRQGRKKGLIGLGTSFTNQYADGNLKGQQSMMGAGMFGNTRGYLAQALGGMNDQISPNGPNQGGTTTKKGFGKTPKGVSIYGFANGGPLYRQTKGTGGWNYSPKVKGTGESETGTTPTTTGSGTGTGTSTGSGTFDAPMTPQEMAAASTIPGGQLGGGLGAAGANRFRKGRSRINQLGISNTGTGLLSRNIQYGNFFNR